MTSRKDSLASFIWTVGAADMVIGGVGERGSLFALGMLTVGAGLLVRWLRQQRYEHSIAAWREGVGRPLSRGALLSVRAISAKTRGVSAIVARTFHGVGVAATSRSPRGYSAAARPGFRANRFVDATESRPESRPRRNPRNAPAVQRAHLIPRPEQSQSLDLNPRGGDSAGGPVQVGSASPRHMQGPPLDLPPAPRPRSRRGRRIY